MEISRLFRGDIALPSGSVATQARSSSTASLSMYAKETSAVKKSALEVRLWVLNISFRVSRSRRSQPMARYSGLE